MWDKVGYYGISLADDWHLFRSLLFDMSMFQNAFLDFSGLLLLYFWVLASIVNASAENDCTLGAFEQSMVPAALWSCLGEEWSSEFIHCNWKGLIYWSCRRNSGSMLFCRC